MRLLDIAIGHNPQISNYELTNAEGEMTFTYNNRKFKIKLSAPRS